VASRLYLKVAKNRYPNQFTLTARARLGELEEEGRSKLTDMETRFARLDNVSPGEQSIDESLAETTRLFAEFKGLEEQYGRVPKAGRAITSSLNKQRRRPRVKAALCEPEAARLWQQGQELEAEGQVCCAFLIYEKALRELPAPSARLAEERLNELCQDPNNIESAEACRNLQWCHQKYRLAKLMARQQPQKARGLFAQIVDRAPAESEVHQAAKTELTRL
jgi:hypothetical protein